MARARGYDIAEGTISIAYRDGAPEWHFVAVALDRKNMVTIAELAGDMARYDGVQGFQLNYARNRGRDPRSLGAQRHHQALSRRGCEPRGFAHRVAGPDACRVGRERRGQIDPD